MANGAGASTQFGGISLPAKTVHVQQHMRQHLVDVDGLREKLQCICPTSYALKGVMGAYELVSKWLTKLFQARTCS